MCIFYGTFYEAKIDRLKLFDKIKYQNHPFKSLLFILTNFNYFKSFEKITEYEKRNRRKNSLVFLKVKGYKNFILSEKYCSYIPGNFGMVTKKFEII